MNLKLFPLDTQVPLIIFDDDEKKLNILKGKVFFLGDFIQLSDLSSDDRQLWMDGK